MLSLHELAWFTVAALLLALTPGPNMIYCVSRTLVQGVMVSVLAALAVRVALTERQ